MNKETPEQELEKILAKVGEHIERHFGHEALIQSGMMLLGVRNEILELFATHYKAREAEIREKPEKEVLEVLKKYPGITSHMDLTENSPLVIELSDCRKVREVEIAKEAEIALARKVLAVSSGVPKLRGFTQAKRLKLLTEKMNEIIPDSGLFVTEESSS